MKKMLYMAAIGLALAGCSPAAPSMTVEVNGAPPEVGEFVIAEKARDADIKVSQNEGRDTAVFTVMDPAEGHDISQRAIQARLSVRTTSGE